MLTGPEKRIRWTWLLALLTLSIAIYCGLGWSRFPFLFGDQGWFLQVSRRVASGEVLYRDVIWCYGPLPVLGMSWLMRHGPHDIVWYSLLHVGLATLATLVLYLAHGYFLPRRTAALATLMAMLGFGCASIFLNAYTPTHATAFLGVLLTLLGLFEAQRGVYSWVARALIAVGIAVACLSKPELALAALALCLLASWALQRTELSPARRATAGVSMALGTASGVLLAALIYAWLARRSGWGALLEGIRGYELLDHSPGLSVGFSNLRNLAFVGLPALLLVAGWLILSERPALGRLRAVRGLLACACVAAHVWLAISLYSGWFVRVRASQVSALDGGAWIEGVRAVPIASWSRLAATQASGLLVLAFLTWSGFLLLRWMLRWVRRERATQPQWLAWVVTVVVLVVSLRTLPTPNVLNLWGLGLVALALEAELPSWSLRRISARSIVLYGLLVCAVMLGTVRGWSTAAGPLERLDTPYGVVRMPREQRAPLVEILRYIEDHTAPDEPIVVLGSYPGLYYVSRRRNPLASDYMVLGMGVRERDAADFVARIERERPALLLVPQQAFRLGILDVRQGADVPRAPDGSSAFGASATDVERHVLERYRLDRILNQGTPFELAAFGRL